MRGEIGDTQADDGGRATTRRDDARVRSPAAGAPAEWKSPPPHAGGRSRCRARWFLPWHSMVRGMTIEAGPFRSHYLYRERGTRNSSGEMVVPIGSRTLALICRTVPQPIIERRMRNWRFVATFGILGPAGPINLVRQDHGSSRQGECGASSAGDPASFRTLDQTAPVGRDRREKC